jgi:thiol-disulfide isomerase/thioredoxin
MNSTGSFVCAFACALLLSGCGSDTPGSRPPAEPAADVRVVDLPGVEAALAEHRGKAVLVNFWAIWCEPCIAELPELVETAHEFGGQDAAVLTVSYDLMIPDVTRDEVLEKVRTFVTERGIDLPVLIYDAEDYDTINDRFRLPGPVPATIAIDAGGEVVEVHEGPATKAQFAGMIRKAQGQ